MGSDEVRSARDCHDTGFLSKLGKRDQLVALSLIKSPTKSSPSQLLYDFLERTCQGSLGSSDGGTKYQNTSTFLVLCKSSSIVVAFLQKDVRSKANKVCMGGGCSLVWSRGVLVFLLV